MPRWSGWPRKKPGKNPNGNTEFAPSVAQADAILARFGYSEARELAAA